MLVEVEKALGRDYVAIRADRITRPEVMIANSFTNTALSRRQFLASTAAASIGLAGLGARTRIPRLPLLNAAITSCRAAPPRSATKRAGT